MFSAIFTWIETVPTVFAKDHIGQNFQLRLSQPTLPWQTYPHYGSTELLFVSKNSIWNTLDSIRNDSLIGGIDAVYRSIVLFNTENKPDSYAWSPASTPNSDGTIPLGTIFIADDSFLGPVQKEMILEGEATLGDDGVLTSRTLIDQINQTTGVSLRIGSRLDFALATRIARVDGSENTLEFWRRVFFDNLTITGIYDWIPEESMVVRKASLFDVVKAETVANSMFMPRSLVNETILTSFENSLERRAPGSPKIFIQLTPDEVVKRGVLNLKEELDSLKWRTSYLYPNDNIGVEIDSWQVSAFTDAYIQSRNLLIHVLPVTSLSIAAAMLSSEITFRGRRVEIEVLKAKGVSSRQLYAVFLLEFLTLALIGGALGFALGTFVGCLIPASTGLLQYDLNIVSKFLTAVEFSPQNFLLPFAFCAAVPLVHAFGKARSLASDGNPATMTAGTHQKTRWDSAYFFFAGMTASLFVFTWLVGQLTLTGRDGVFFYIILLTHWIVFSYCASLIISKLLPKLSGASKISLKTKSTLLALDFKRLKAFTLLTIILVLTSSIMVFSLAEAETVQNNTINQIGFSIGCDIRIVTVKQEPLSFAVNITHALSGMISNVTPVISSYGRIAGYDLNIIGLDIELYKNMDVSIPEIFKLSLAALQTNPNGAIVGESMARALHLNVGSQVSVSNYYGRGSLDFREFHTNLTVVGMAQSAPGFGDLCPTSESTKGNLGFQEERMYILVNRDFLTGQDVPHKTRVFFVRAEKGSDSNKISQLVSKLPGVAAAYFPTFSHLEKLSEFWALYMQSVTSSLNLQFLAAITIGILVLAFFLQYMISERRLEYAVMRAIGATRKDITAIILAESILLVITALVFGSLLGMAYTVAATKLSFSVFPFRSTIGYEVTGPILVLVVSSAVVFLFAIIGSYFPARKAGQTNVAKELRNL